MARDRLQNLALIALVAALLLAVVTIYQTFMTRTPRNLKGHIAVEGSTTANPPAPDYGAAAPAMQ